MTGMALAYCILGKFSGVLCLCFPPPLDVPTFAARCLYVCNDAIDPTSERWKCGREICPVFCLNSDFHVHLGVFYMPQRSTTWYRRLYFASEGRRAEDFFALKIRRLRPGLNPRTWVLKASTLPLDHRSRSIRPYVYKYIYIRIYTSCSVT